VTAIHPLHDPDDRVLLAELGAWQLRQFAEHDSRLAYFAAKGFAHVQLWHAASRISIVSPSKLTGGNFEVWIEDARFAAATWAPIEEALIEYRVEPPNHHEIRAIERWFVLRDESRAGRLLRSWWAGVEEHAR
jgi:hypothetical protein